MPRYVYSFLSHAHADNVLCDPYAAELTRLGAPHYYDREVPQHGALLPYLLQDELLKSRTLVVLVTPAAQVSQWVKLEIAMFHHLMANDPDRRLVWVRLVDCVVEPLLAAHLGIDAVGRPQEQVVAELARALEDPDASHPSAAASRYSRIVDWHQGMGDHTSIVEAIAAAHPGEVILVRKGHYEGALVIDKPLEIIGDGQLGDVEVHSYGTGSLSFSAIQGRVANLKLSDTRGGDWYGVSIGGGRLELEDCDITSQAYACVGIESFANPHISRCRIHQGSKAGVLVTEEGKGLIEDCDISANYNIGIEAKLASEPTVRNCRIDHNRCGVLVFDFAAGLFEDCEINANKDAGVEIKTGGSPTIRNCRIHDNFHSGVLVHQKGEGLIEDCEISANRLCGVNVQSSGKPTVRNCHIHGHQGAGVLVWKQGGGIYDANELHGNIGGAWEIAPDSAETVTRRDNIEREQEGDG